MLPINCLYYKEITDVNKNGKSEEDGSDCGWHYKQWSVCCVRVNWTGGIEFTARPMEFLLYKNVNKNEDYGNPHFIELSFSFIR